MPSITVMPVRERGLASARGWRASMARMLLRSGARMNHWAWRLAPAPRHQPAAVHLEFSALGGNAGQDGALYHDGQLVGTLAGVRRL